MKQTRRFAREPASVAEARAVAVAALAGTPRATLEVIELMVSELATNCIRHAGTAFDVTVRRAAGKIRVEVTDRSSGQPTPRTPGPEEPSGRGLRIVAMLSAAWGVEHANGPGKTVWFTVTDHPPADALVGSERSDAPLANTG